MGRAKKSERSARSEEQEDKEPEPYQPTGNFQTDFAELCKELEISRPPAVVLRAKRPASPEKAEHTQVPIGKKGKEDKKASAAAAVAQQQMPPEPEEETAEEKAIIEILGFKPKTFTVKNHVELMRPTIQVEMDNPERQDSVTEVFIKDWKLQVPMLNTLGRCLEKLQRLHSIHLWRIAADTSVINTLAELLTRLPTVKSLALESNGTVPEENYAELIKVESNMTKLRLRFNQIGDKCASAIGEQLDGLRETPSKLISLDLSSNVIQDEGAFALAKALRTNRTMIHLSLSNNKLTDKAAAALAHVCSRFFLTHEETVQRRQLMSVDARAGGSVSLPNQQSDANALLDALSNNHRHHHHHPAAPSAANAASASSNTASSSLHPRVPPPSRKGADRPASVRSQEKDKKATSAAGAAASAAKGPKGKKEEKPKPDDKSAKGKPPAKEEAAKPKGKAAGPGAQADKDAAKGAAKSGKGKGARVKMTTPQPDPEPEVQYDTEHPLLERADTTYAPGYLLVPGNYNLALLNLSRNQITERGVEEWKTAIRYQAAHMARQRVHGSGMLKLLLQGNPFSTESESYKILEDALNARDPLRPSIADTS